MHIASESPSDPTRRFSSRVENYVKYRPSYPRAAIDLLGSECALNEQSVIADVGSGTGILSKLLLGRGYHVIGVEPNEEMRGAAERLLESCPRFESISGRAEGTTLADGSVDLITVAQAFHWFDREQAKEEFLRILGQNGWVALIWNVRQTDTTPFLRSYEAVLKGHVPDYEKATHRDITPDELDDFFSPSSCTTRTFANEQLLDFESLKRRLLSSSYSPEAGHPKHDAMVRDLKRAFEQHEERGEVAIRYATEVHYGQL